MAQLSPTPEPRAKLGSRATRKNWMGVVALIASFVCCFQLVGLVMGILGLRAAKNGEATNRGLSLFAVWWSGFWIVVIIALSIVFAADPDGRSRDFVSIFGDAGADVAAIDQAIHDFQDEHSDQYVTALGWDGENYYVGDVVVEAQSSNPTIRFFADGNGGHCIEIRADSSSASLSHGVDCVGAPQPVLAP